MWLTGLSYEVVRRDKFLDCEWNIFCWLEMFKFCKKQKRLGFSLVSGKEIKIYNVGWKGEKQECGLKLGKEKLHEIKKKEAFWNNLKSWNHIRVVIKEQKKIEE